MKTRKTNGFTLMELLVVVAIVAILASIALPIYADYVLSSKLNEAFAMLSSWQLKMDQYYQDNRTFLKAGSATACAVDPPTGAKYFYLSCVPYTAGQQYTLTADSTVASAAQGLQVIGFTYTLTESGAKATPNVPSGWANAGAACWVKNKAGGC